MRKHSLSFLAFKQHKINSLFICIYLDHRKQSPVVSTFTKTMLQTNVCVSMNYKYLKSSIVYRK